MSFEGYILLESWNIFTREYHIDINPKVPLYYLQSVRINSRIHTTYSFQNMLCCLMYMVKLRRYANPRQVLTFMQGVIDMCSIHFRAFEFFTHFLSLSQCIFVYRKFLRPKTDLVINMSDLCCKHLYFGGMHKYGYGIN
jgi:hypothetical protein